MWVRHRFRIEKQLALALAFMDRSGPIVDPSQLQPIQRDVAKISLIDLQETCAPAIAMCWHRLELTWAAVIAIAGVELQAMNFPIYRHRYLV